MSYIDEQARAFLASGEGAEAAGLELVREAYEGATTLPLVRLLTLSREFDAEQIKHSSQPQCGGGRSEMEEEIDARAQQAEKRHGALLRAFGISTALVAIYRRNAPQGSSAWNLLQEELSTRTALEKKLELSTLQLSAIQELANRGGTLVHAPAGEANQEIIAAGADASPVGNRVVSVHLGG